MTLYGSKTGSTIEYAGMHILMDDSTSTFLQAFDTND